MSIRKDDPLYYKIKFDKLIKQAIEEGLNLKVTNLNNGARISFIASNGDTTGITILNNNNSKGDL